MQETLFLYGVKELEKPSNMQETSILTERDGAAAHPHIHHSASTHCTWRDADAIGTHLVDPIAIAVQRCTGMALQSSMDFEMRAAMGARAA